MRYSNVVVSEPRLAESQIRFRLGLVRQRTRTYPLDSMDFVMMDLERPHGCYRHAHWCTGDLTGRLLEFLSYADGVDGQSDPRMKELFERILLQARPSGAIGRYAAQPNPVAPEEDIASAVPRLLPGLIQYHELTGDARALDAAVGMARYTLARKDAWHKRMKDKGGWAIEAWVTEPMAMLYGVTGETAYLDFAGMIAECLQPPVRAHSHGYLSTLRGLQVAALVTGDRAWTEKVDRYRQFIIDRQLVMPDGCVPEVFPPAQRNEGCSIADWIMVNLNAGLLNNDDTAYAAAEHALWNAFAFNQFITGALGTREITATGYGVHHIEECVWCCTYDAGLALSEVARQAVTWRGGAIHVNLLVPGDYRLRLPGGAVAQVRIGTAYPARAEATVEAVGVPSDVAVKLRVPECIRRAQVQETRMQDRVRVQLRGVLGHHVRTTPRGKMLCYGPLVMAPIGYNWSGGLTEADRDSVPVGYIPEVMPKGLPQFALPEPNADGLLALSEEPLPAWTFHDGGPNARCAVAGSPANVPIRFPDGQVRTLRFVPECYFTSCLAFYDTPVVFS